MHVLIAVLCFCAGMVQPSTAHSAERVAPFSLIPAKETVIALTAASSLIAGAYFVSTMTLPDPASLDKKDIVPFDRFATRYYSKKDSHLSDYSRDATIALSALSLLPYWDDLGRGDMDNFITDVVMFLEAEAVTSGLTMCAKGLAGRPRPYAYHSDLSLSTRRQRSSFESFWSGHASISFTTAVMTGYVYQKHYPDSPYILPVWIGGLSFATAAAVLRVNSGYHFPTDVLTGAVVGSCIGWLIPSLHEHESRSIALTGNPGGVNGLGLKWRF